MGYKPTMQLTDLEDFDPDGEWHNYGDVNPEPHGGRFVKWTGSKWELVVTYRCSEVMPDGDPDAQIVTVVDVYPDDVFVDGDPSEGLTDTMKRILGSLGDENYDPDQYPDQPTEYAPEFLDRLAYYVADFEHHIHGRSNIEEGEYSEILENYGVEGWE